MTPTHKMNEKILPSKWIGKTETHSHHKSHSQHRAIKSEGNAQLPASPKGVKDLDHISNTPTFKAYP